MPVFFYQLIVFAPLIMAGIAGILAGVLGYSRLVHNADNIFLRANNEHIIARIAEILTCAGVCLAALLSCIGFLDAIVNGTEQIIPLFTWMQVGGLEIGWVLKIDMLSSVMLVVVTGVSALVHVYSIGYMSHDSGRARFFAYLSLFTFMMLMLVTADNFVQLFFGWEGVGLASYLLIGFWYHKPSANAAAIKAFIVNRVGDFGLIMALGLIYLATGTLQFDGVFAAAPILAQAQIEFLGFTVPTLTTICLLLFMGAMGKSAQFFLHTWLPDAMEGPTPVSALIHAATMVTAGVFLLTRCSPLFELSDFALTIVIITGAITAFFAATIGLVQNDIKRVIAYSTCSQLGYMFVAIGLGAYQVAMFHLFTHAFFKALLFLGAGSVIHAMDDEQDMRKMGGILSLMPASWFLMLIGTLALTGFPPLAGYFSKDAIIEAAYALAADDGAAYFSFWMLCIAAFMTSFYSWRLMFMTFHRKPRASNEVMAHVHESPPSMLIPLIILALGALIVGGAVGWLFIGAEKAAGFWGTAIFTRPDNNILHLLHNVPAWVKLTPIIMMLSGFGLAWVFYIWAVDMPARLRTQHDMIYNFLHEKWYFDEIYHGVFVRPLGALSRILWKYGDGRLIDGFGPDGIARLVQYGTHHITRLQSGYLYHYAFVILLGVVGFVSWFLLRGGGS